MQLSVMGDYVRVFGTGQTLVQGGPIEFFVREAGESSRGMSSSEPLCTLRVHYMLMRSSIVL